MQHGDAAGSRPSVAMVLRRTPPARHGLSQAMTGVTMSPGDVWWELVDPAAGSDDPPAGVALTRCVVHDVTHVVVLRRSAGPGDDASRDVLPLLVAALRGTSARQVSMNAD